MLLRVLRTVLLTSLGVLALIAFFDAAKLHGGYKFPYQGVRHVPQLELVFYLWYAVWGCVAVACLAGACHATVAQRLVDGFKASLSKSAVWLTLAALTVFLGALLFRHLVLLDQPIADDELVYQFSARSLSLGRLTGPPPLDASFLQNQFMIVDAQHWHGKYPIGHALLWAPFELIGRPDLMGPLIAVASLLLTYQLALRFTSAAAALLAVLLLVCSPHFLWTHATLMSQTSSGLTMLLAVFAWLRHQETQRPSWLVLMGVSLGFGILTRPLPGVLVAAVLIGAQLHSAWVRERAPLKAAVRDAALWLPPVLVFVSILPLCNYLQSGSMGTTGYREVHATYGAFQNIDGELTNSLGGALVRENMWLFGWPCSLLFIPFARFARYRVLFWLLVATTVVYRVIVPKTVVSTTGPIYVTEVVPLLCIASAAGIAHVVELLRRLGDGHAERRVAALVFGSFVVAAAGFAPVELRAIHAGAQARAQVADLLLAKRIERAVVFGGYAVLPSAGRTWAVSFPNPWPDLRDDILYLRVPAEPDGFHRAHKLWRERFSDRPAFVYDVRKDHNALLPLQSFLAAELAAH